MLRQWKSINSKCASVPMSMDMNACITPAKVPQFLVVPCCSSKALLLLFIKSELVSGVLEEHYINNILDFLRKHVFPYEELYARCYFLRVRALDAYSNTPHEGTNAGAKHCEKRVLPSMSQTESTKTLTEQDQERGKDKTRKVADSIHKTQLHSSNSNSQYLQKEADSQLEDEMQAAEKYISIRINSNTWFVICGTTCKSTNIGSMIPSHLRVFRWLQ